MMPIIISITNIIMRNVLSTRPIIPQTKLNVPIAVDILADFDLLRDMAPRMIPPKWIFRKFSTKPIIPRVWPGFSIGAIY